MLETRPKIAVFQRVDWLSFGSTTAVVLLVYLLTLAPNVTLDFSGIFSTAALYGGVPHPTGYPVWTLCGWLFIKVLPFSNIAWRLAVFSAITGALVCGLISLMVSREGKDLLSSTLNSLSSKEKKWVRVICGSVAGMVFGFSGAFWGTALVANPWPLTILLFTLVLAFLFRWSHAPERKKYLYWASFAYGLALTNSQLLLAAVPAIPFLVMAGDRRIAREFFVIGCVVWTAVFPVVLAGLPSVFSLPHFFLLVWGLAPLAMSLGLVIKTQQIFSEWKPLLFSSVIFVGALSFYLYLPLSSLSNPPMNWGYSRTVEGFLHVIQRGQYERVHPTPGLDQFLDQLLGYGSLAGNEFGWACLVPAIIPFFSLRRTPSLHQGWMAGLLILFGCLSVLMAAVLNPPGDLLSRQQNKVLFSGSFVVLALWMGYGLTLVAAFLSKYPKTREAVEMDPKIPKVQKTHWQSFLRKSGDRSNLEK